MAHCTIMGVKVVNHGEQWIGFRLNILGIRVWEGARQLVAKNGDDWVTLGARRLLPLDIPATADQLRAAASDPLRLTAYQYALEHEGSELGELLSMRKSFRSAALESQATAASLGTTKASA